MSSADRGPSGVSDGLPPFIIDRSLALTRAATIKARDYWQSLLRGRPLPAREDITPRDMREILPYVGLVDVVALANGGEDYALRLTGGKIEEVFGPITGKPISKALPPETALRWRTVFDEVRSGGIPLAVTGRVAYSNLRHLKYELFVAPLGEGGQINMLFGALDIWPVG